MSVVNLAPDTEIPIAAGQIRGSCYVYRMGGYDQLGDVAWAPADGPVVFQPIRSGETVRFPINGQAGEMANLTPATVQLLWDNQPAQTVAATPSRSARKRIKNVAERRDRMRLAGPGASDPAQAAMQTLNAQWYNAIVTGCGLDPQTFQLVQGSTPLGTTSDVLWNLFDAIPPLSVSNYFNPSQFNSFASDYGSVINNLIPQNSNSFQSAMGDYYPQWVQYLKSVTTLPAGGILALFQTWSQINMPPNQAQVCYTDYQQISQGTVPAAVQLWINAGGSTSGTKAYNKTIAQLNAALSQSRPVTFSMNSSYESSDISETWANAEAGFLFDIFEIGGEGSYDHVSVSLASGGLSFDVEFDRLVTFSAGPLSQPSTDPILSGYQPWYSSAALSLAYSNNNNLVWNTTAPTWAGTFGPNGNMQRTASAIVVVDGITITMTSNSSVSTEDQTQVQSAVEGGVFPFFEASADGGWSHDASFDASGMMTIKSTCPLGNPQILGVIVTPISGVVSLE